MLITDFQIVNTMEDILTQLFLLQEQIDLMKSLNNQSNLVEKLIHNL